MLNVFTIVLDGMPMLPSIYASLVVLPFPWRWTIVEGVAANVNDTSWCKKIEPRLSNDGTTEFLDSISSHPNITIIRKELWEGGKTEQCNAALATFHEPGVLMQMDADEIWPGEAIIKVVEMFKEDRYKKVAQFFCNYFVGPNICSVIPDSYGNNSYEWYRAWRFVPGDTFASHEPPILKSIGVPGRELVFDRYETISKGMFFNHFSYTFERQVAFKEEYYGYAGAVESWKRLQKNQIWPCRLKDFLPWVDDRAQADMIRFR